MRALSHSSVKAPPADSRVAGLYEVRRWLILLLLSEAWIFAALAGVARWRALAMTDRALLVIGAVCLILGWFLSRRPLGLWLVAAAPLCLVLATVLNTGSPSAGQWVALGVSMGHVTYAIVLLTPRLVGLAGVVVAPMVLALVWADRPTNVVPGALDVMGGWFAVLSLFASAGILWFVWNALLRQARADDTRLLALTVRIAREVEVQERSRMWRSTVVKVHERLLSTLRYLLQTETLDRDGLRALAHLDRGDESTQDLAADVREATAARIAAGIVRADPSAMELPITEEARLAVRAAIVECALNAVLHGGATDVHVSGRVEDGYCAYEVSDNGTGIYEGATPGLGWTTTLDEGLEAVGGMWSVKREIDRTVITVRVPKVASNAATPFVADGFQQGRVLISAPLMAFGLVGMAYSIIVALTSARGWPLLLDCVVATLAAVVIVARRRQPSLAASSAVIAGLAAIPWLMTAAQPVADDAAAVVAGVTTAGYAVIAVGVWSRWWQWTAGLIAWALGVLLTTRVAAEGGALPIIVALVNCLVIVPVVVVVASIGSHRYQRAQAALALERDAMNREALRANSAQLIDQHLAACVAQADSIIAALAHGADLDDDLRHEVQCLEGLIRATIQVDPVDAGEFTRVAGRLVNTAFSLSVPAQVGTLVSSGDTRALNADLVLALESLIHDYQSITVRTFSDGRIDHLSLILRDPRRIGRTEAVALLPADADDAEVDMSSEEDGSVIVLVSRQVRELASA